MLGHESMVWQAWLQLLIFQGTQKWQMCQSPDVPFQRPEHAVSATGLKKWKETSPWEAPWLSRAHEWKEGLSHRFCAFSSVKQTSGWSVAKFCFGKTPFSKVILILKESFRAQDKTSWNFVNFGFCGIIYDGNRRWGSPQMPLKSWVWEDTVLLAGEVCAGAP